MANTTENGTGAFKGRIPLNVTLHAWPIPNLKQTNETNYLIEKTTESAKNYTNSLHNLNATGYVAIDDDLTDTGLTDVQTFILAGVATVIPLLIVVVTALGIRFLWRRYRAKKEDGYEGVLQKEESSEPLGKLQSYSLPQELKSSESQFTMTSGDDQMTAFSTQLPVSKSNGSVITMTLRNNHLIVETEETTNLPEGVKIESKGTTTKFVTLKAPDFRLESNSHTANCTKDPSVELLKRQDQMLSSTNHGALIHCAPEEVEDELEKENCNTGLSQSDLSVSSSENQNPSYRYGNQTGYDSGGYGYPEYCGYTTLSNKKTSFSQTGPKSRNIYQRSFSVTDQAESNPSASYAGGQSQLKDILMSDIQAREKREYEIRNENQDVLRNGNAHADTATSEQPKNDSNSDNSTLILDIKEPLSKNETFHSENYKCLSNNEVNGKKNES